MKPSRIAPLLLVAALCGGGAARADEPCSAPESLTAIDAGSLPVVARRLAEERKLVIVVFGTAGAAGAGTSGAAKAFSARLAAEIARALPDASAQVLLKAKRGRTASQMVAAMAAEVWPERPDLVIWEIGGADAARATDIEAFGEALKEGLEAARAHGADVLLIDPQFAPHLAALAHAAQYQAYVARAAESAEAPLLRRYALMRHWHEEGIIDLTATTPEEQRRASDFVHRCLAELLAAGIAAAAQPNPDAQ